MITDERLDEIRSAFIDLFAFGGLAKNPNVTDDELYHMASELLTLREQKRKLVEDGVRLATSLRNIKLMFVRIEVDSDKKYVKQMDNALDLHNALVEEVE